MVVVNSDSSTVLLSSHITVGPFLWSDTKVPQSAHKESCRNDLVYCLCRIYSTVAVAEELAEGDISECGILKGKRQIKMSQLMLDN